MPQASYKDVLQQARDLIHQHHRLVTHPLSGSIKPNETPYKSVVITDAPGPSLDINSLNIIEESLAVYEKFAAMGLPPFDKYPSHVLEEFMIIDHQLIAKEVLA